MELNTTYSYYDESIFYNPPKYNIVKQPDNSFRVEWEEYFLGDSNFERWMIITYNKESNILYIDFEYANFKFKIENSFDDFFNLYKKDVHQFVAPLSKRLVPSIEDSIDIWESILFDYFLDEKLTDKEYTDALNFFRTKCYIQAPPIVIENIILESALLNSLFKAPNKIFSMVYTYPFCTKFFLKFIVPILYDVIVVKKILD